MKIFLKNYLQPPFLISFAVLLAFAGRYELFKGPTGDYTDKKTAAAEKAV